MTKKKTAFDYLNVCVLTFLALVTFLSLSDDFSHFVCLLRGYCNCSFCGDSQAFFLRGISIYLCGKHYLEPLSRLHLRNSSRNDISAVNDDDRSLCSFFENDAFPKRVYDGDRIYDVFWRRTDSFCVSRSIPGYAQQLFFSRAALFRKYSLI